jgi:hypothetical protein
MGYVPKPIDTSAVTLPPELTALVERLAANVHEIWAAQRIKDGWNWGPQRDDQKKLHPCLVPYDQLPESEKEYDRVAVLGVLRVTLALGYEIKR